MNISLITVSYNSCSTLKETIASVREQNMPNLEYIVVDGGSVDGTIDLLKASGDIVTLWISEPDKGIYDAMNKGLNLATGDIIGFIHADDLFANDRVLHCLYFLISENRADLLYGDLEYVSSENPEKVIRFWKSGPFDAGNLKKGWMPPHPTVYFRRRILEKYGSFNTGFSIAADYEWMLRVLKQPGLRVNYLPEVMVRMRLGGASNKSLSNVLRKSYEDYQALRMHGVGGLYTLFRKNVSKLGQFIGRRKTI